MNTGVLNQVLYPEAGDVDDCWVVATVQAKEEATDATDRPTVTEFRASALDPDDGQRDGGTLTEVIRGAQATWPNVTVVELRAYPYDLFLVKLQAGGAASLAVNSRYLPSRMRYGFLGLHQVAVGFRGGKYYLANPLAPQGSEWQEITVAELRLATSEYSNVGVYAAYFPEAPMKIRFDLERWAIDGDPSRLVTTFGAPYLSDGVTVDWTRRLALLSDRGGANVRLEFFPRARLRGAGDPDVDAELTNSLATFSIPEDERVDDIKQKIAALAADIAND